MMAELAKAINEAKADNPQIEQQIFRPTTRRPTPARIPANPISPKREKSPSTSSSYSKASTKRLSDSRESSPEVVASGTAEIVPSTQPPESPAPKRQNTSNFIGFFPKKPRAGGNSEATLDTSGAGPSSFTTSGFGSNSFHEPSITSNPLSEPVNFSFTHPKIGKMHFVLKRLTSGDIRVFAIKECLPSKNIWRPVATIRNDFLERAFNA